MPEVRTNGKGIWNARLVLVCLSAVSVSLPMAWISLAKALVLIAGLTYLCMDCLRGQRDAALGALWTPHVLALILCIVRDALRIPAPVQQALIGAVAATAVACLFNSALYDDLMGDFFCINLGLLLALGVRSTAPATPRTEAA